MHIRVIYALPHAQHQVALELEDGATVEEALRRSGLLERFPEIDLTRNKVGIFGKFAALEQSLRDGDRIEIYRPLARRRDARAVAEKKARIRSRKAERGSRRMVGNPEESP